MLSSSVFRYSVYGYIWSYLPKRQNQILISYIINSLPSQLYATKDINHHININICIRTQIQVCDNVVEKLTLDVNDSYEYSISTWHASGKTKNTVHMSVWMIGAYIIWIFNCSN